MENPNRQERIGGTAVRVGDCYVWYEIHYLDSPTDYRELLQPNHPRSWTRPGEFVMLDDKASLPRVIFNWFLAACSRLG
jgi:hypothetical protein